MASTVNIEGLDAVLAAMQNLPASITKNALPYAMRKAAQIWQQEAQRRAPVRTGNLKSRIAVRKRKRNAPGIKLTYSVGLLGGASASYGNTKANRRKGLVGKTYQKQDTAFYWRFLEFGTEKMKARPFLRPAFDTTQDQVVKAVATYLQTGLDRAVKKAQKP